MIDEKVLIERLEELKGIAFLTLANTGDKKKDVVYDEVMAYLNTSIDMVNQLAEESNNNKSLYEITLNGCDDDTFFVMELTENEYQFLLKVSEKANETSTYGCMPRLYVEKCEQPLPAPYRQKE